jgi:hypothetical protein
MQGTVTMSSEHTIDKTAALFYSSVMNSDRTTSKLYIFSNLVPCVHFMFKQLNKKYHKITSVLKQCEHLGKKAEKAERQPAENRETFS